jgi:hypothetical protein
MIVMLVGLATTTVLMLVTASAAMAQQSDFDPVPPGYHFGEGADNPCPLDIENFPPGTVCGEGGGYLVPAASASVGTAGGYPPPGVGTPSATVTASGTALASGTAIASGTATASAAVAAGDALPATGGAGLALLVGVLLLGAGVLSYAVMRRTS